MKSFGDFPKEDKRQYAGGKINITDGHIDRCIQKMERNEPIIIDFFCHGMYNPEIERISTPNFLLTLAKTGRQSTTKQIRHLLRLFGDDVKDLLYGNLDTIYGKVNELSSKVKEQISDNTEMKLYNGLKAPHFNEGRNKIRKARFEKKAPPVFAVFSNEGLPVNSPRFFLEPDGVYFLEDTMDMWRRETMPARLNKRFTSMSWGGTIPVADLKKLHKVYDIKNPDKYYKSMSAQDIEMRNLELLKYYDMKDNVMFRYVKHNSLYIPEPTIAYPVNVITEDIKKEIEKRLRERGITKKPVILFTFLQCKSISLDEDATDVLEAMDISDEVDSNMKHAIGHMYMNYISPSRTEITTQSKKSNTKKAKQAKHAKQAKQTKQKTAKKAKQTKKDLCKDLVEIDCKDIPECVFIEAGKIKKCVSKDNKGKTQKKPRAKGTKGKADVGTSECKGLPEAECKLPKCIYTRGKRRYCRKGSNTKRKT
jgi:hypothetical protein